jgi:serine/threonine-protein kinase
VAPGGYRVLRLISQSVHGRVYLAVDGQGQRVALKELLFALVPGAEQLDAFEREAAVLRSLSHPAIPRFLASFKEGSGVGTRLYLAQEFLEGESLLQRIERRRLDEAEAWTLAEGMLETLQALHQRTPALIHRDVKPANLILRPDGRVALVDFGAARHLAREVTHGSTLVGTFGYMPPEQLGGTVEPSSDLYALGATLVHALTGRMPADLLDEALAVSFEKHLQGSAPLKAFLRRLLAPKRSERFASAAEALAALRATRPAPGKASTAPHAEAATVPPAQVEEAVAPVAQPTAVQGTPIAEGPRSKRRVLVWALAGMAVAGSLLLGLGLVGELLASRSEEVVYEDGTPTGEVRRSPAPSAPVPTGDRHHRNFRTPWPSESR